MNRENFQTSDWYRALTLTERIASTKAKRNSPPEINADLAQRRMERWRNQAPFSTDSFFSKRLTIDGINKEEFFSFLGEPIEAIKERFPEIPSWLTELAQAFLATATPDFQQFCPPEANQNLDTSLFLYLIAPLISQGLNRLSEGIQDLSQQHPELPFQAKAIIDMLLANLTIQLRQILDRTLVLELNVARLQGLLTGDTPEERFRSFIERLRQPDVALSILQEYPVLARQTVICMNHWLTFSLEFLQHLCADWDEIRSLFAPENEPGLLIELHGGAGDQHRGGRSVLIAQFSSGLKLVYKPRSLAVDVHFQELLTWLNECGEHSGFRTLKVLDRGHHGWVEYVTAQSCQSLEEIQRFYERQGGYLALLYALQATDFHSENLVAAGEHPVLIDLESLFHPPLTEVDSSQAEKVASEKIAYSVLSVGLLPERIWGNDEIEGIDISGLGTKEGQLTPNPVAFWQGVGTDEMRLQRQRIKMAANQNRPTLDGVNINLLDYTDAILTGFRKIYQLLLKHRDELLSPQGLIAAFNEDEVRILLRATRIYGLLLNESFHPDVLRDALERDRHFDGLWLQVQHQAFLQKAIAAERDDLLRGDIPMFTSRPNSRHLWTSDGHPIYDFIQEPGINLVYRRLQQLSNQDLTQQLWFIRGSLATAYMGLEQAVFPNYTITEPQHVADCEQFVTAARAIGDRLESLAVRGTKDVSWIGLTLVRDHQWTLMPLGLDLYDGLPGIVLFLAYLGAVTNEEHYTALAQDALTTMLRLVEKNQSYIKYIGAFDGWGGIIYTLTHLAVLWNQPALLAEAEKIVARLPKLIEQDKQFDIMSGAAGCIASLLSLYHYQPSNSTLTAAIQCGDRLIASSQLMKHGIGWITGNQNEKPLTGFSHGAAGIAWALLELASVTGEQRFATTGLAALEYERSLFLPEVGNWPDLRNFTASFASQNSEPICMNAWCHGASGIGLSRLRCLSHLTDTAIHSEINTALKTTLAEGFGSNHSLCHGDLGNLELLLQASFTLNDPYWETQVQRLGAIILESIEKHGWLCGVPLGVETPGLMSGLAGIGYGLLRLAAPELVSSVLVLEPPKLNDKVLLQEKFLAKVRQEWLIL